jgi:hypothetical protein
MSDGEPEHGALHLYLSPHDAANLAAALRQYEPYWRPADPGHGEELGALVRDITRWLAELQSGEGQVRWRGV